MALTSAQESVLEQIIEAFENGKRLTDLPVATGADPFNLIVEVVDTDGESKQAALATMLPYVEDDVAYGIRFDTTVSSPECTRIGNTSLHQSLPVQSRMKGVLLDDDGNVTEYLDPSDWRGQTRDGSRGQVMVELPQHYRKCVTNGNYREVRISEYCLPGYQLVKKQYVSAYQATVDRTNNKLASVVNMTEQYRGCGNQSAWDGTYRTALGKPASTLSRGTFRNYARKRKEGSTEWNCMVYDIQKELYWLYVIEYATLNSQKDYTAELDSNGYHQGGLGAGVSNWSGTEWNNYNGYYPFVPCGHTDEFGNSTGVKAYEVKGEDDTVLLTTYVPRYRGVENPFGHIWQWTDGINVQISPTEENGGDGLSKVFTCSDPALFSDSGYDGYTHVGNEARTDGYVKEVIFGENGEIMPSTVGAGSTTYFCDYHYTNIPTSSEVLRGVFFGGRANYGADAGLVCAHSCSAPATADANIGSRLCFIPA